MGEVVPVLLGLLGVLIIVVAVLSRNSMRGRLVVKRLDQEDRVERVKIHLKSDEALALSKELAEAAELAKSDRADKVIEHYEFGRDDRLIRFEIDG